MISVQNGSVISKNNTPMLWLRLLGRNRAITVGREPVFLAVSAMRFLVAGAIYLANGALFNTIETVAGENPLCVATSFIVTAWFFSLGRFTRRAPRWPTSSRQTYSIAMPHAWRMPTLRVPRRKAALGTSASSKYRRQDR